MPVDPALLEILVCPECKTPVRLVRDGAGLKCDTAGASIRSRTTSR
jgi:uncharacterized protein YbaR (Trm112 family)